MDMPIHRTVERRRLRLLTMSGLLCCGGWLGPRAARAECPADTDREWSPADGYTIEQEDTWESSQYIVCILQSDAGFASGHLTVSPPWNVSDLQIVGENPLTPVPALTIGSGYFRYTGSTDPTMTFRDLDVQPEDDTTPAISLLSPSTADSFTRHVFLESVNQSGGGALLQVTDSVNRHEVHLVSTTHPGDTTPVSTCAERTVVNLYDNGLQSTATSRTVPLLEVGACDSDADRELILSGTLRQSSLDQDAPGLVPDAALVSNNDTFTKVELRSFTAENVHCDPCVSALRRVVVKDTTWQLEGAGSMDGGTLFSVPGSDSDSVSDSRVKINNLSFQTDGPGWSIADADQTLVYQLDACMPGTSGTSTASVFNGTELDLWNSVIVHPGQPQPLWSSSEETAPRLRGVTVVTAVDDGTALTNAGDTFNTLFVQPYDATGSPLPADFELPDDVVVRPYDRVFQTEAAGRCLARAIPDAERNGTRGKGRAAGPAGITMLQRYCDEVFGSEGYASDPAGLEDACGTATEEQIAWCDPDGTWPDVGAWSGPVADPELAPDLDDVAERPCFRIIGSGDTAVLLDTGDLPSETDTAPPASASAIQWGGTCRGAALWVPLTLLPLLLLRRNTSEPHA